MKILISALQIMLGLYFMTGGLYMMGNYKMLANIAILNILPGLFWTLLGLVQVLLAGGLILAMFKKYRNLKPVTTRGLMVISLLGIVLYSSYAGMGSLWALLPAVLLMLVARGRN